MKCPHCLKQSKAKVLESRVWDGKMWRRRTCGLCFSNFVSMETTSPDLRMPSTVNGSYRAKDRTPKPEQCGAITSTAAHLQGIWR